MQNCPELVKKRSCKSVLNSFPILVLYLTSLFPDRGVWAATEFPVQDTKAVQQTENKIKKMESEEVSPDQADIKLLPEAKPLKKSDVIEADHESGQIDPVQKPKPSLTASSAEVAKDLGLLPAFDKLNEAASKEKRDPVEILLLREELLQTVLIASFEIRAALAKIDLDISQTNELRSVMDERRETKVQYSDVANFLQSGTTEILATSLADFNRAGGVSIPGAIFGVVGGALEIGISTYSARLNEGEHRSATAHPNALAQVFGYDAKESTLPSGVWNYLNDPRRGAVTKNDTRRAALIRQWVKYGRAYAENSPLSRRHIQMVSGVVPLQKTLTIDLLRDRSLMLEDLRSVVSLMDLDMLEIMRCVKSI